jgi:hypothetical protein
MDLRTWCTTTRAAREASRRRSSDWHKAGHGAGIVFILIMRGVERVENQDLGGSGPRGGDKVIQTLGGAEQMA